MQTAGMRKHLYLYINAELIILQHPHGTISSTDESCHNQESEVGKAYPLGLAQRLTPRSLNKQDI